MKKYNIKTDTLNERQFQRLCIHHIYPRVSRILSERGFVKLDVGRMGGSHWYFFYVKDNKS